MQFRAHQGVTMKMTSKNLIQNVHCTPFFPTTWELVSKEKNYYQNKTQRKTFATRQPHEGKLWIMVDHLMGHSNEVWQHQVMLTGNKTPEKKCWGRNYPAWNSYFF